jgi:carbon starvation protein
MRTILFNALLSVALMLWLAWNNGFTLLWPMFATANQLLAALALIAVSAWLLKKKRQAWFTILPAIFMVTTTIAALLLLMQKFVATLQSGAAISGPLTLLVMTVLCLGLALGLLFMAIKTFRQYWAEKNGQIAAAPK